MTKRIILWIGALLVGASAWAQNSDVMLTQQWFSRLNRNPAATGNSTDFDFFLLSRFQWTGFDDAPRTFLFNGHSYYEKIRSGIGMSVYYDRTGIADEQISAKLSYSYHVDLKEDMLLSFGLSGGVMYKMIDYGKHVWDDEQEQNEKEHKVSPDFDFGIEYSIPKLLLGASIRHIAHKRDKLNDLTPVQHFYAYARGNFRLSNSFDIAPDVVYQNSGKINDLQLGATVFYKKKFWLGLDYKTPSPKDIFSDYDYSTLSILAGAEFSYFRIGYSYDLSLGKLSKISRSVHEVMLSARIPRKKTTVERFVP